MIQAIPAKNHLASGDPIYYRSAIHSDTLPFIALVVYGHTGGDIDDLVLIAQVVAPFCPILKHICIPIFT
jgi:phage tail protein X